MSLLKIETNFKLNEKDIAIPERGSINISPLRSPSRFLFTSDKKELRQQYASENKKQWQKLHQALSKSLSIGGFLNFQDDEKKEAKRRNYPRFPTSKITNVMNYKDKMGIVIQVLAVPKELRIEEDILTLEKATTNMQFFQTLNEKELHRQLRIHKKIVRIMEHEHYNKGDMIIQYGDIADRFYILLQGEVNIFIPKHKVSKESAKLTNADLAGINISDLKSRTLRFLVTQDSVFKYLYMKTLQFGASFGEVGLLHKTTRTACILAKTNCDVAYLDRKDYIDIMSVVEQMKMNEQITFFQDRFFKSNLVDPEIVMMTTYCFKKVKYLRHHVFFKEQDVPQFVYFIKKGNVLFVKRMQIGISRQKLNQAKDSNQKLPYEVIKRYQQIPLTIVSTGFIFGAEAILQKDQQARMSYTAKCDTAVTVFQSEIASFLRLCNDYKQVKNVVVKDQRAKLKNIDLQDQNVLNRDRLVQPELSKFDKHQMRKKALRDYVANNIELNDLEQTFKRNQEVAVQQLDYDSQQLYLKQNSTHHIQEQVNCEDAIETIQTDQLEQDVKEQINLKQQLTSQIIVAKSDKKQVLKEPIQKEQQSGAIALHISNRPEELKEVSCPEQQTICQQYRLLQSKFPLSTTNQSLKQKINKIQSQYNQIFPNVSNLQDVRNVKSEEYHKMFKVLSDLSHVHGIYSKQIKVLKIQQLKKRNRSMDSDQIESFKDPDLLSASQISGYMSQSALIRVRLAEKSVFQNKIMARCKLKKDIIDQNLLSQLKMQKYTQSSKAIINK